MEEKEKMKKIYEQLTPENKNIINLVAQGMQVSQQNINCEVIKNDKS